MITDKKNKKQKKFFQQQLNYGIFAHSTKVIQKFCNILVHTS